MRTKLVLPVVLLVLLVAGCGSASDGPTNGPQGASSQAASGQPPTSAPAGNGKVDCATIKVAAQQLLMVQFLAQLRDADGIEAIKTKQIGNLDLDAFLAGMHELHALDSTVSPLGDAKAAIDYYEKAGAAAKVLFATEPMTQAAIDTYNQNVGTVADFLGHQMAISGAMSAAGC